jgi:hypothetical protein
MIHIAAQVAPAADDPAFQAGKRVLSLQVVNTTCLSISCQGQTITIDPSQLQFTPDIAVGYAGLEAAIELAWDSERFNSRDMAASLVERKGIADLTQALFMVGFDGQDMYLITRQWIAASPDGVTFTPIVPSGLEFLRPRLWLTEQSALLKPLVIKNKAKRTLLSQIKTGDSLAALEYQVDLLSQLVLSLMASQSAVASPSWLAAFQNALTNQSSLQFKGADAVATEIGNYKAGLRTLQKNYISQRSQEA